MQMKKSALMIIDYQNAVFADPPAFNADMVLERIRALIANARTAGAPVVYVQHEEAGTPWEAASETWRFPDAIAPQAGDIVSPKHSCDAFRNTGLQALLAEHSIERIFVCGYATEFCIDTSVRRAASLELETVIVSDAHTTRHRPHLKAPQIIEHHNWVWREISNPGNPIRLCASDEVKFDRPRS
jgi:nicotinamidase-related amidase